MEAGMKLRLWFVMFGVLLLGCADRPLVYNVELSPGYNPTEYGYGAGRRDLTTEIYGDPFRLGEEPFQARFVEVLNQHQSFLQPTHFTTSPGPSARPIYRAVFLFDRAIVTPTRVCTAPASVPPVDLGDTVRVTAGFCRRGGYLSSVTGEVKVSSLDDPRFGDMIGQMILLLFPPVDPNDDDRRLLITRAGE
jgi:hypothetical protein